MLRTSLKEKEVLLAEIHHRVKNNLAVVSSMMQLQLMEESDEVVTAKLLDSISRIGTMAAIHEDLYSTTDFSAVTFTNIVGKLTDSVSSLLQGGPQYIGANRAGGSPHGYESCHSGGADSQRGDYQCV